MSAPVPVPAADPGSEVRVCPGCGGRNRTTATECDWCGRPFLSQGRRLRLAGWQLVSTLLVLAVVAAIVGLGVLNSSRTPGLGGGTRPAVGAASVVASPTLPITPRVVAAPPSTPTPRPTATQLSAAATPSAAPTATPVPRRAMVVNTGGQGVTVRRDPGPQAATVGSLREGTAVLLPGGEQTVAARPWREIEEPSRGLKGWVAAEFLQEQP